MIFNYDVSDLQSEINNLEADVGKVEGLRYIDCGTFTGSTDGAVLEAAMRYAYTQLSDVTNCNVILHCFRSGAWGFDGIGSKRGTDLTCSFINIYDGSSHLVDLNNGTYTERLYWNAASQGFFTRDTTNTSDANVYYRKDGRFVNVGGWFKPTASANAASKTLISGLFTCDTNVKIAVLDETTGELFVVAIDVGGTVIRTIGSISSRAGHVCSLVSTTYPCR